MSRNKKLDDKKRKLAEKNIGLLRKFYKKNIKNGKVPENKKDDFLSDLNHKYCRSALKYNEETGFKFSTFANKSFNFCLDDFTNKKELLNTISFDREKGKKIKDKKSFVDKELLKFIFECSDLSDIEKKVLILYYYHNLSFIKIGEKYSYHKEKIRRIEKRAIRKLKKYSKKKGYNIEDFIKI